MFFTNVFVLKYQKNKFENNKWQNKSTTMANSKYSTSNTEGILMNGKSLFFQYIDKDCQMSALKMENR